MVFNFIDLNSPAHDLLTDDYVSTLSLKTKKQAGPVQVTLDTQRNPSNGTLSTKLSSKFNICKFHIDKLQLTQDANGVLESTVGVFPNTTLGFNGNHKTADLSVEYKTNNLTLNSVLDVQDFKQLKSTGKLNCYKGLSLASEVKVDLVNSSIGSVNLGLSYTINNLFASLYTVNGIGCPKKCTSDSNSSLNPASCNLGVLYHVNPNWTLGTNVLHSYKGHSSSCMTIGGLYKGDFGKIKMKVNCCGDVKVAVMKDMCGGVNVTVGGGVNVGKVGSSLEWGLGVTL